MKKIFLFFLAATCFIISCTKVDDPPGISKLDVQGATDTVIVPYNTIIQYSAYPAGIFSLSKPEAGVVDVFGKFKSDSAEGTYKLIVVNARDISDTVVRTIIVSKHASLFNNMKLVGGYLMSFRHADASRGVDQTP